MRTEVIVNLSTALTTIAVMVALYVRLNKRLEGVDRKFEGVEKQINLLDKKIDSNHGKLDSTIDKLDLKWEGRFDSITRNLVDVKILVARIEGFLEAQYGFTPTLKGPTLTEPAAEEPAPSYQRTG